MTTNPTNVPSQAMRTMVSIMKAITETIRETEGGVPSGILYAGLSEFGMSLQQYETIIDFLKNSGMVKQTGNLLFWID